MKILSIVGARPQFIKAAAVSRLIKDVPDAREVLVHTGQHYDENMSDIFFSELDISKPNYHLGVGSLNHGAQTGRMMEAIEKVLLEENPEWVLVYGDTNSTLAGALAAAKLHIPVAHVEAGLRSFNRRMPEEINRIMTDHISDLLFAPTKTALTNLSSEGIPDSRVRMAGDVMYDAALFYGVKAKQKSNILQRLLLSPKSYILTTIHRAENTSDLGRLLNIIKALDAIAREMPVILPLHPRTRATLENQNLLAGVGDNFQHIRPVGYLDMVMLEKSAGLIVTDSGGVQKEAFFFSVPCVTLREETEWVELVELGWNRLVSPLSKPEEICRRAMEAFNSVGMAAQPFGDGRAAYKILAALGLACISQ